MLNETQDLADLLAKYKPAPGSLLLSPIENPGDEAWLKLVGHPVTLNPYVIERMGPCVYAELTVGRVVYVSRDSIHTVSLDREQMFAMAYENAVRLTLDGTPAVTRKTRTPKSAAMMMQQNQNADLGKKLAKGIAESN